jgi:hypothetical protein
MVAALICYAGTKVPAGAGAETSAPDIDIAGSGPQLRGLQHAPRPNSLHEGLLSVSPRRLSQPALNRRITATGAKLLSQQCEAPSVPHCNSSAAVEEWSETLAALDLEGVLYITCKVFSRAGQTAVLRYPPEVPEVISTSGGVEATSIGGAPLQQVR